MNRESMAITTIFGKPCTYRRNSRIFSAELRYPEDVERITMDMNEFLSTLTDLGIRYKVTGKVTDHMLVFEVLM